MLPPDGRYLFGRSTHYRWQETGKIARNPVAMEVCGVSRSVPEGVPGPRAWTHRSGSLRVDLPRSFDFSVKILRLIVCLELLEGVRSWMRRFLSLVLSGRGGWGWPSPGRTLDGNRYMEGVRMRLCKTGRECSCMFETSCNHFTGNLRVLCAALIYRRIV